MVGMRIDRNTWSAPGGMVRYGRVAVDRLEAEWKRLTLVGKFAVSTAAVVAIGMLFLIAWISGRIERGILDNTITRNALSLASSMEGPAQGLARSAVLSDDARRHFDQLLTTPMFKGRVASFKVWGPGGRIVYSDRKEIVGKEFPESDTLKRAWDGVASGEFDHLHDAENEGERALDRPLFEVYVPLRDRETGRVIAVGEVYEFADELTRELREARWQTAFIVGTLGVGIFLTLLRIVLSGSQTITSQQQLLAAQVDRLTALLADNKSLQVRIATANMRAGESNEALLRRIGADLHDGPAQLLSYALLRLNSIEMRVRHLLSDETAEAGDFEQLRGSLVEAFRDLRNISASIALPELDALELSEAIALAARSHERRTGTTVALELAPDLPRGVPRPLIVCIYRIVQEGLNNAFWHAEGRGQRVAANWRSGQLEVRVVDQGDGLTGEAGKKFDAPGLGLRGLRDRVISMGGELHVVSTPGKGTELTASFDYLAEEGNHG
jgi:signal transduction histidine kinase